VQLGHAEMCDEVKLVDRERFDEALLLAVIITGRAARGGQIDPERGGLRVSVGGSRTVSARIAEVVVGKRPHAACVESSRVGGSKLQRSGEQPDLVCGSPPQSGGCGLPQQMIYRAY
jgi:hypothetical protein